MGSVQVPVRRPSWVLYEAEPAIDDNEVYERRRVAALAGGTLSTEEDETSLEAYRRRRREALIEALQALREGKRLYSRRVISSGRTSVVSCGWQDKTQEEVML
jgi:hypothetical protein